MSRPKKKPRSFGIRAIEYERNRQIEKEGFSDHHDDDHGSGELADAAVCYAISASSMPTARVAMEAVRDIWPWDLKFRKIDRHDRKRRLIIAGALIAAELDRLDRKQQEESSELLRDALLREQTP